MAILADYHTHTPLCKHAEGKPEEYVDAAIAAGLKEYGISDHAPMYPEPFDDWRMLQSEVPEYLEWIERATAHAAGRIPVRMGLECDWLAGFEAWTEKLKGMADWDYLIGSVHYLGSEFDFDNPKWLGKWSELDVEETWQRYWDTYAEMADSGLFHILGHPDLIKKFAYRPEGDLSRFYEPVIDVIASSGSVIELNTAGWHKPCDEQYPHVDFLDLANQAGIGLVISSDAHAPGEVARDFEMATVLAKQAGYEDTMLVEKGKFKRQPMSGNIFL